MSTYLENITDFYLHYALAVLGVVLFLVIAKWGSKWVGGYVCAGLIFSVIVGFSQFTFMFILPITALIIVLLWIGLEYTLKNKNVALLKNKCLRTGPIQRILGALSMLYLATIGIPSVLDNYYAAKYHEEETLKWQLEKKLEQVFKPSSSYQTHPHKKLNFEEWEAQQIHKRDTK
jgi:hypothetical protein